MNIQNYNEFKQKFPLGSHRAATLREEAYLRFQKNGMPSKKEEAWKYTSTKSFSEVLWHLATEESHLSHEDMKWLSSKLSTDFYNFVFVNGQLNQTLSDDFENWIEICETTDTDFTNINIESETKLVDLAKASAHAKLKISVPANKIIEKPIQILFVQKSEKNILTHSIVDFELGENAQAKLIAHFVSLPSQTLTNKSQAINSSLKVILAENSNLQFVQLQNENHLDFHFSRTQFELKSGAQLLSLDLALGAKLSRHYLQTTFVGQNASAGVYGLTALAKNQHADHYTFIHHTTGANQSIQHYKSVLTDDSHSVFRGRVRIEPDAQKANSEQLNNNLLLTRTCNADSVPQLEIYADDVKAGHGSTMGQLNADEIFYFLSRGIGQTEAVRMLAFGYAQELVYKFENNDLQNWILKNLTEKLESMIPNV
jgi:Fe-S cluster assembly protein SufD